MNSATHHTQYLDTIDRRRQASADYDALDDRRSEIRRHQREYPVGSEAYDELEAQIKIIDDELTLLNITKGELQVERDRLALIEAEGFDYVRPSRFVSRFLPALPKGTREAHKSIATLALPSTYWRTASLVVSVIVLLVLLQCIFVPSLVTFGLFSLIGPPSIYVMDSTTRIVIFAAIVLGACGMLGAQLTPRTGLSQSAITTVSQYVLGAEKWTWSQRLRSCLVYGLYDPTTILLPGVFVPARFILMLFVMHVYLRTVTTEGQSPAIAAAATVMEKSRRVLIIILCVLCILSGLLLVA